MLREELFLKLGDVDGVGLTKRRHHRSLLIKCGRSPQKSSQEHVTIFFPMVLHRRRGL